MPSEALPSVLQAARPLARALPAKLDYGASAEHGLLSISDLASDNGLPDRVAFVETTNTASSFSKWMSHVRGIAPKTSCW